jgi:hypothetical protein
VYGELIGRVSDQTEKAELLAAHRGIELAVDGSSVLHQAVDLGNPRHGERSGRRRKLIAQEIKRHHGVVWYIKVVLDLLNLDRVVRPTPNQPHALQVNSTLPTSRALSRVSSFSRKKIHREKHFKPRLYIIIALRALFRVVWVIPAPTPWM